MLDLLLYGKWRLQVINFLEACCCLATWCQIFPPLGFMGHWRKLHPIVSIDTIPASRSSKRLRELVSIYACLGWNSGWDCVLWVLFFDVCLIGECSNWFSFFRKGIKVKRRMWKSKRWIAYNVQTFGKYAKKVSSTTNFYFPHSLCLVIKNR